MNSIFKVLVFVFILVQSFLPDVNPSMNYIILPFIAVANKMIEMESLAISIKENNKMIKMCAKVTCSSINKLKNILLGGQWEMQLTFKIILYL